MSFRHHRTVTDAIHGIVMLMLVVIMLMLIMLRSDGGSRVNDHFVVVVIARWFSRLSERKKLQIVRAEHRR